MTRRDCDGTGLSANASDHIVTVVFRPPSGPQNAVVLTAAADCSPINPQLGTCAGQLSGTGAAATCVAGAQAGLEIVDHDGQHFLSFRFPDTRSKCSGGANDGKRCTQASDCPGSSCVAGNDDGTLAGPAAIAVGPAARRRANSPPTPAPASPA